MTFTLSDDAGPPFIGGLATLALQDVAPPMVSRRRSALAAATTGLTLLALFVPQHMMLGARFPVWYHLTFLLSLGALATWAEGLPGAGSVSFHPLTTRSTV